MGPSAALQGRLAGEAAAACRGLEVRNLADAPGGGVLMLLGTPGEERIEQRLLIVAEPDRARLHLCPARRPERPLPDESAFVRDALPWLRGALVRSIAAAPGDRLVEVRLDLGGAGRRLIAELFGAVPNLLVVDGEGIVRALKRARRGARAAAVGADYRAPAAPGAPRPGAAEEASFPRAEDSPFAAAHPLSAAVDAAFHGLDLDAALAGEKAALLRAVEKSQAAEEKRLAQVDADAARGADAARERELGDLLAARFAELRRGMAALDTEDLYRGGTIRIPLDPLLEPRGNVEAFYRRARKMQRAAEHARERRPKIAARLQRLKDLGAAIAAAASRAALQQMRTTQPEERRPAPAADRSQRRSAKVPAAKGGGIRRFRLRSGLVAAVGKTARDNDVLTTRLAKGDDVWLHVQGGAGSHVVVHVPRGKTASLEDLLDAGRLAVHFSKRRGAARCDVMYTHRKHVRKPRGAAPGAVTVERHKTLDVRAEPQRLRALLEGEAPPVPDGPLP